jgi:hypothetical protein
LAITAALGLCSVPAWAQYDNELDDVVCQTVTKGVLKFKPALNNVGSALPQTIQVGGTLGACKSNTNANLVFPEGKSKFKGVLTIPTSPGCLGLLGPSGATGSITFSWNATENSVPATPQKILWKTSIVNVPSGGSIGGLFAAGGSSPQLPGGAYGQFSLGAPNGAAALSVTDPIGGTAGFKGGDGGATSSAFIVTQQAGDTLAAFCGLTPPLGVKSINIGVGSIELK